MGLSFAEKAFFFAKQIGFPNFKYKNEEYFNLVHAYISQNLDFLVFSFCD